MELLKLFPHVSNELELKYDSSFTDSRYNSLSKAKLNTLLHSVAFVCFYTIFAMILQTRTLSDHFIALDTNLYLLFVMRNLVSYIFN